MSIFDVIKYPLSDPPMIEELASLPPKLYSDWCRNLFGGTFSIYYMSGFLQGISNRDIPRYEYAMQDLKRRITEYECV